MQPTLWAQLQASGSLGAAKPRTAPPRPPPSAAAPNAQPFPELAPAAASLGLPGFVSGAGAAPGAAAAPRSSVASSSRPSRPAGVGIGARTVAGARSSRPVNAYGRAASGAAGPKPLRAPQPRVVGARKRKEAEPQFELPRHRERRGEAVEEETADEAYDEGNAGRGASGGGFVTAAQQHRINER